MSTSQFASLPLKPELLASLAKLAYQSMTPIQEKCLPYVLKSHDLIAQAKTGSGKTAAFSLGLLSRVDFTKHQLQALVLCPTRELAEQVASEIRRLASSTSNVRVMTLCGGKPVRMQMGALMRGAPHIAVATPGRIQDLLRRDALDLSHLRVLVLDEADRMLGMGFGEEILAIAAVLPKNRQTLLFSATYPHSIAELSETIQRQPVTVKVESLHKAGHIEQVFYKLAAEEQRMPALRALIASHPGQATIIFCNTKVQCQEVLSQLQGAEIKALAIHGDLEQREREEILVLFKNGSCSVLVASDVASRGLDIKELQVVINYELPRQPEVYVHRIGRTGRAGEKGLAFSLCIPREQARIGAIESYQQAPAVYGQIAELTNSTATGTKSSMVTLKIAAGRRNKICKGDILGALTGKGSPIAGPQIGKIDIFDDYACVAVNQDIAPLALKTITSGGIKGRLFKAKRIF